MFSVEPKDLEIRRRHGLLLGGIGPRPIAFVSTLSKDGVNNLAPFSFFNAFGANPPSIAFSPARRGRDNTTKDTYHNLLDTGECVVHAVTYDMVQKTNLASGEYPSDVDEFIKAGFTPIDSDLVKPKRVKESPFHLECKLIDMVSLGTGGGAGNLAICEVIKYHISEDIMTDDYIDPYKIDLVGRNGGNFYTRSNGDALFQLAQPGKDYGMGYDNLPDYIKQSEIYSANDIGKMAIWKEIPNLVDVLDKVNNIAPIEASKENFERHERLKDYKMMFAIALSFEKQGQLFKVYFEKTVKTALLFDDKEFAWEVAVYLGSRGQ